MERKPPMVAWCLGNLADGYRGVGVSLGSQHFEKQPFIIVRAATAEEYQVSMQTYFPHMKETIPPYVKFYVIETD